MARVEWAPLVLTPVVLAGWLLLFALLIDRDLGRRLVLRVPGGRRLWQGWWKLSRVLRRGRDRRRALERSRRFDADSNAKTTPPEEVAIRWGGIWTVEIYTPAHMPRLIDGLRELGLDTDRRFRGADLVTWLSSTRTGTGAWMSPGPFSARGGPAWHLQQLDLPCQFSLMIPTFMQLAPGLVALMTGWVLTSDEQRRIEDAVREPAESTAESLKGGGTSVTHAEANKAARVGALRRELRDSASRWIGGTLPGLFARELASDPMPAWDLLLTDGADLAREQPGPHDWRDAIGYSFAERWNSDDTCGLTMVVPRFSHDRTNAVPALLARREDVVFDDMDREPSTFEDYSWSLMQRLDDVLGPLFGWWAVERAFDGIDRLLAEAREELAGSGGRAGRVRPRLDAMRKRVLPAIFHVSALARGARALEDPDSFARHRLVRFEGVERGVGGRRTFRPNPLEQWIAEQVVETSDRIQEDARNTEESWRALTDILLARSNLNLQNTILVVTAVATLASLAAVVIALNSQ